MHIDDLIDQRVAETAGLRSVGTGRRYRAADARRRQVVEQPRRQIPGGRKPAHSWVSLRGVRRKIAPGVRSPHRSAINLVLPMRATTAGAEARSFVRTRRDWCGYSNGRAPGSGSRRKCSTPNGIRAVDLDRRRPRMAQSPGGGFLAARKRRVAFRTARPRRRTETRPGMPCGVSTRRRAIGERGICSRLRPAQKHVKWCRGRCQLQRPQSAQRRRHRSLPEEPPPPVRQASRSTCSTTRHRHDPGYKCRGTQPVRDLVDAR